MNKLKNKTAIITGGVTEILCVYKGKLQHKLYSRIDDKKTNGYAKLETIHDKEISSGDVVIVSPPNDIHGFKSLSDDTFGITIVNGNYKISPKMRLCPMTWWPNYVIEHW